MQLDPASPNLKSRTGGYNYDATHKITRQGHVEAHHQLGIGLLRLRSAPRKSFYEQYHPYGTSAYRAWASSLGVSAKRYRYNGKERDDETKLYYYGARYYAPWLGRWTAADPLAFADGVGSYTYVRGSPIVLSDPNGKQTPRGGGAPLGRGPRPRQRRRRSKHGSGPSRYVKRHQRRRPSK